MKTKVIVKLKDGVLDPQGKAIEHAAKSLGYEGIHSVRVGKVFELEWEGESAGEVQEKTQALSEKLLANTVIENFTVIFK